MKAGGLLLLIILNVGLASGALYGAAPAQTEARQRDAGHQAPTKTVDDHPATRAGSKKGLALNRPTIRPNRTEPATLRQLPAAARNAGSTQNEAIYRALPVRPGSAIQPGASSTGSIRHRGPNAAVVGGAAIPIGRNTAALDGTHMNLKTSRN